MQHLTNDTYLNLTTWIVNGRLIIIVPFTIGYREYNNAFLQSFVSQPRKKNFFSKVTSWKGSCGQSNGPWISKNHQQYERHRWFISVLLCTQSICSYCTKPLISTMQPSIIPYCWNTQPLICLFIFVLTDT